MSTRYFDSLPTELVRNILQDVDCLPPKERHVTLRSLCLTSKLLRAHAQLLLLRRVYTSIGVKQDLLKLLVENNSSASLALVHGLIFDEPKLTKVSKWLKQFVKNATNLQEAYVTNQVVPLKALLGSNITTLALRHITIKLNGAPFSLPELLRLSINSCPIHHEGGLRFSLPKLKHFAFIGATAHFDRHEVDLLNLLASNLVSFTVTINNITILPPSILNHPTLPVLCTTWMLTAPPASLQGVRHLLRPIRGQDMRDWTDKIRDSVHQIETLTLMWYGEGNRPDASVTPLLTACRVRNIEVIWEHRPDPTTPAGRIETFFDLVPSSFIQRSEARQARKRSRGGQ